jgi:hypothetical protein
VIKWTEDQINIWAPNTQINIANIGKLYSNGVAIDVGTQIIHESSQHSKLYTKVHRIPNYTRKFTEFQIIHKNSQNSKLYKLYTNIRGIPLV